MTRSSFIPAVALLRQTNPSWVAYFFVTDTNPFELRLQEILAKYRDPRLVYTTIPPRYRVPVRPP
jgi:hypothetical protein